MDMHEKITALYKQRPKTDRDLVRDCADDIADALSHGVAIIKLFAVMREGGFKGDRKKFTRLLQEQGLYTIKKKQPE